MKHPLSKNIMFYIRWVGTHPNHRQEGRAIVRSFVVNSNAEAMLAYHATAKP